MDRVRTGMLVETFDVNSFVEFWALIHSHVHVCLVHIDLRGRCYLHSSMVINLAVRNWTVYVIRVLKV